MVIYLDELVVENIIVNYFLLYITSRTVRIKMSIKKIIVPAAIGGFYVLTVVFQSLRIFTMLPFKLLIAFIMILLIITN
jgi:stage II sporulation protein GA (sporulation sigma-E factor processing peptidase)